MNVIDDNAGVLTPDQIKTLGTPYVRPNYAERLRCFIKATPKNLKLACGHKLDATGIPSINCPDCWKVFFIVNKEMTSQNVKVIDEGREAEIAQTHGNKYLKQLKRFVVFVGEFAESNKEQDGN